MSIIRVMRVFSLALAVAAFAADAPWPQFRGPGSNGVAEERGLPERWSETENVVWKTAVPGAGWSSPVVAGGRIFLTSVIASGEQEAPKKGLYFGGNRGKPSDEHRWMVYAYDFETGKLGWERQVHRAVPEAARHLKNTYASETPVTDGERIYTYFGGAGLFCFDLNGKPLWEKRWPVRETRYGWGTSASPVLHEGRVYVVNDNDVESYLVALDKRTGREIWRVAREEKSNWSTPFAWTHGGKTGLVTTGTGRVRSYDLDGKVLWEFGGMSSIVIPTPFARHGLLYIASGYVGDPMRPAFAVKPGARGDISLKAGETSNAFIAWHIPQGGPYNPSPLVYGDIYYTLYDRGLFTAHDAKTGAEVYGKQRIDEAVTAFTASPWAYGGKVFAASEDGDTYVIQAGREFRVIGKNSLGEMIMATPAMAGRSLIVRTAGHLYRIQSK